MEEQIAFTLHLDKGTIGLISAFFSFFVGAFYYISNYFIKLHFKNARLESDKEVTKRLTEVIRTTFIDRINDHTRISDLAINELKLEKEELRKAVNTIKCEMGKINVKIENLTNTINKK